MKRIDKEIFEIENRLHLREAAIRQAARQTRQRTLKSLKSPVTIVAAVALGFVVAGGLGRRRAKEPALSQETKERTKGFALGTLLMTAATWFIRHQFGGPVGFAQFVLSKIKSRKKPAPAYQ
jgi:hypothetical protein